MRWLHRTRGGLCVLALGVVVAVAAAGAQRPLAARACSVNNCVFPTFTPAPSPGPTDITQATQTTLATGEILQAGGCCSPPHFVGDLPQPLAAAFLYRPQTGTWTPTGSLNEARRLQVAALLHDGRVLVVAGVTDCGMECNTTSSTELYAPQTGTWTMTAPLPEYGPVGETATTLQDGRVLVAGGILGFSSGGELPTASAFLYDPTTGTWSATGSMTVPRSGQTATLLPSGQVLVSGGNYTCDSQVPPNCTADTTPTTEEYDPATGTWTADSSLPPATLSPTTTDPASPTPGVPTSTAPPSRTPTATDTATSRPTATGPVLPATPPPPTDTALPGPPPSRTATTTPPLPPPPPPTVTPTAMPEVERGPALAPPSGTTARKSATRQHRLALVRLSMHVPLIQHRLRGQSTLTITVQTRPRSRVTSRVRLTHLVTRWRGHGSTRHTTTTRHVLYQGQAQARADGHGQATLVLHLRYNPPRVLRGTLEVTVRTAGVVRTRSFPLLLTPAPAPKAAHHGTTARHHHG